MKSRKSKVIVILTLLVLNALVFNVLKTNAYLTFITDTINNVFKITKIDIDILEEFDDVDKTNIRIKNNSNVDTCIRLKITNYFIDEDSGYIYPADKIVIDESDLGSDWEYNTSDDMYYVKGARGNGNTTGNLSNESIKTQISPYAETLDLKYIVELSAQAIMFDVNSSGCAQTWENAENEEVIEP